MNWRRALTLGILTLLLTAYGIAERQWQLQGHQERGGGGRDGLLRCDGIKLDQAWTIVRVECSSAGFWITDDQGTILRYSDPRLAVGTALGPGTYWAYPNLLPQERTATVTLFLAQGGAAVSPGLVKGTSWKVGVLEGDRRLPPHSVPWVFQPDGTVEAPGLWKGSWKARSAAQVEVRITHMGNTDAFVVTFDPGGRSFVAHKDGKPYRHGTLVASAAPTGSPSPSGAGTGTGHLDGDWALTADHYGANLELRGSAGRIFFHAVGRWEPIDQVSSDRNGNVSFRRPEYAQLYRGRFVTPDRLEGNYVRRAGEGFDGVWSATRVK